MKTIQNHFAAHIRGLQFILRTHFGANVTSSSGENTLCISPDKVEMTNSDNVIVAKGPARVATVLVRKKRRSK